MAVTASLKVLLFYKHLPTDITSEGFDTGVEKVVFIQTELMSKLLSADTIGERFDAT